MKLKVGKAELKLKSSLVQRIPIFKSGGSAVRTRQLPQEKGLSKDEPFLLTVRLV